MKEYLVHVTDHTKFRVFAKNSINAKEYVWEQYLKDGYQYGFKSKEEFMKGVKVEKVG